MPHKVLVLVIKHLEPNQDQSVANATKLIAMWCLLAARKDSQGDSWVLFAIGAITEGNDKYLAIWIKQHL